MRDSPLSLAINSPESGPALACRPLFKSIPSGVVVDAFIRHVEATGAPETFDRISTTKPPDEGLLRVLTRFRATRAKRPRGDLAPCPICSPWDPQFLVGVLVWCEATSAIYAIGLECSTKLWREGRLDQEIAAYDLRASKRELEDKLLAILPLVPASRRWVAAHLDIAIAADRLSRGFRRRAPRVYSTVKQAFSRGGELPIRQLVNEAPPPDAITLVGATFVKAEFNAERRLARIDELLLSLDSGDDPLECIETISGMPEEQLLKALKFLREADKENRRVFAHLEGCALFLSTENMARLARWSELPGAPFRLMAYAERGRVKIYNYRDKSDWGDALDGMLAPEPPPLLFQ